MSSLFSAKQSGQPAWRVLNFFNSYRFLIAFLFVTLGWVGQLPLPLGIYDRTLFTIAASVYLSLSIIFIFFIHIQKPAYFVQVVSHVFIDVIIITILMFASAGLNSGFGVLLVIAVAGGAILLSGKIGFLFASVATLSVLAHEVYVQLTWELPQTNYPQAGFLGISFFAAAFISDSLATRAQQSEALAEQRAIDLEKVSRLNNHIVQRLQSGIIVLDNALNILLINEAATNLLNIRGDTSDRSLRDISAELSEYIHLWMNDQSPRIMTLQPESGGIAIQASFSRLELDETSEILVFVEDVSVLRQRAQQLKLASLGRLTASIAHEIRNPLGAISHAGQLLSESHALSDEESRLTKIIGEHSDRVNNIIENVMNISRRDQTRLQTVELDDWLKMFIEEFRQRKNLNIKDIEFKLKKKNEVQMDSQQLHQVLWNLCENGIRYSTRPPLLKIISDLDPDTKRPFITVTDNGPGIAEQELDKLYEPFFTTRSTGSGLGLYIARELCEANQAALNLQSNSGEGCCFRIMFSHPEKQCALV